MEDFEHKEVTNRLESSGIVLPRVKDVNGEEGEGGLGCVGRRADEIIAFGCRARQMSPFSKRFGALARM